MRILVFIALILLSGCSSVAPGHFSLNTNSTTYELTVGDTLFFDLSNPKQHDIQDVRYSLNDSLIDSSFKVINRLGNHRLIAKFNVNSKPFSVEEKFIVFAKEAPEIYTYKLINTYPHDKNAYTQGLEFYKGDLFESTGQYGLSSIRKTNYKTGEVIQKLSLDASYFGEGLTFINDQAIQLTWKENIGFVYDPTDFKLLRSFD